jgi:hypothetical protein
MGGYMSVKTDKYYGKLIAGHRTFYYNSRTDNDTDILQTNNINGSITAGYYLIAPLSVFITASERQAMDNKTDKFDYSSAGVGVTLDKDMPLGRISASSRIEWLEGDLLSMDLDTLTYMKKQNTQRLIPVSSDVRYTVMLNPQLMGYLSYANSSFYDTDQQEMLFNSQFVRCSGKYTWLYDGSNGSFTEIGAKYSPGDEVKYKSSAVFARSEMKVINRLYLGAGFNYTPDRLTRYEGLIRYYFTPWNEVFIDNIYTDDPEFDKSKNFTSLGVRMMF